MIINGYDVIFNSFWCKYQVSHENIGSCIAEFNNLNDVIDYCERG